jgi:hypothetical protein
VSPDGAKAPPDNKKRPQLRERSKHDKNIVLQCEGRCRRSLLQVETKVSQLPRFIHLQICRFSNLPICKTISNLPGTYYQFAKKNYLLPV